MAVSEKQLAANRANAQQSTGPKDTSQTRFNGIKHGLTALHALLPWEHKEDLEAVLEGFEARYLPTDTCERLLVKNAAQAYWRLERSLRVEAGIFETVGQAEVERSGLDRSDMHAGHLEAISFIQAESIMDRYRRYDAHLQRAFDKALARVEQMASLRKPDAEPLPPPEPEPQPEKRKLKRAVAHLTALRKKRFPVLGEILPHSAHDIAPGPAALADPAQLAV